MQLCWRRVAASLRGLTRGTSSAQRALHRASARAPLSAQAPPYPSTLCHRRCFRDCHSRKEAYDFKGARTSITDHFELLDDFLIGQLSGRKVRVLIASLTGWSREKFASGGNKIHR